jgi:hypothetical protein
MKITNVLAVLTLPATLFAYHPANASTNDKAIQACAGAIADLIEEKQGKEPAVNLDYDRLSGLDRLYRSTVYEMDVTNPSTENVVGRFTCVVNTRAEVQELVTLPLDAPSARDRVVDRKS